MKTVAYCHPLVPSEWIEAHGLRAAWIVPRDDGAAAETGSLTGMCAYARAVVDTVRAFDKATPIVLTTACDQMRRGAGLLADEREDNVFSLNVPSTRESAASRAYYADELRRLGRWLVARGGQAPTRPRLAETLSRTEASRDVFRRGELPAGVPAWCNPVAVELAAEANSSSAAAVALGVIGGPLRRRDLAIARAVFAAGGQIVLDGTCGGWRTLPAPLDTAALAADPWEAMVAAYFDAIPAVFDRPNHRLHAWLARQIDARQVRGLLCLRHVGCDLWRAALARLKETAGVPILEIDLGDEDRGAESRTAERLEAMIESLAPQTEPRP